MSAFWVGYILIGLGLFYSIRDLAGRLSPLFKDDIDNNAIALQIMCVLFWPLALSMGSDDD